MTKIDNNQIVYNKSVSAEGDNNKPLLAVWVVTYNHEHYISKSIEAIINQKTNFEYRVFIGDDCSTDRTREICLLYQEKYPNLIKLICTETNNMRQNSVNIYNACFNSGAKYIALCEGDDYWTDENKLQKQVDFLEKNTQCVGCFHNADIVEKDTVVSRYHDWETDREISDEDIILRGGGIYPTASLVFRNVIQITYSSWKFYAGDTSLLLLLLKKGSLYYMHDNMSAYRIHSQGAFTSLKDNPANRVDFLVNNIQQYQYFRKYLGKQYNNYVNAAILVQIRRIYNIYGFYSKESLIMFKHLSFNDILRLLAFKIKTKYKKASDNMK